MKMDESTIAKSGELLVEEKRFLKTAWVKRFCVLYKKTADNHAYLEIYDDKDAFEHHKKKNKKCEKRIELQNLKSIKSFSENSGKGMEHHIEIRTRFHKHTLMFNKESDFNDWLGKLNAASDIAERGPGESSATSGDIDEASDDDSDDEVITLNQMYASTDAAQRYEVEVEPSDLAKMCDIEGKMTLLVGNNDLAFEDPRTKRVKYSFHLAWMRRFGKYKSQSFNFEVGRKCPNGEGSVSCITPSAKLIHKTVTQKSASRSKTIIPHPHTEDEASNKDVKQNRPSVNHVEDQKLDALPQIKERQATMVSQPVVPVIARKHPGKANTPNLIPIVRQQSDCGEGVKKPKSPPQPARRGSKSSKSRSSGKDSPTEDKFTNAEGNGLVKQSSHIGIVKSGDFTKKLEQTLQHGSEEDHEKHQDHTKKDSVKTKEDKKREKDEKKEREKREKEEKKERERKEKELEKERKLREKEEKKSGKKDKNRESNKSQDLPVSRMLKERIYDEPEITPKQSSTVDDPSCIYDEASSPMQQSSPIEYAQSMKKGAHASNTEDMYEDAESVKQERKNVTSERVEYAEPYSKKGGVPVNPDTAMYADVQSVGKDAWKKLGRKEEEECFEEDYSNIKSAREIVKKQEPPPVPAKNYGDDDEDDSESMYNTADLKGPKLSLKGQQENLYGMASAKEVGPLPTDQVLVPEADYPSDSEEDEATYDDPQYEGYEPQAEVKKTSSQKTKVVEAYEEAVVPVKPITPKKKKNCNRTDL